VRHPLTIARQTRCLLRAGAVGSLIGGIAHADVVVSDVITTGRLELLIIDFHGDDLDNGSLGDLVHEISQPFWHALMSSASAARTAATVYTMAGRIN
jgi:hypothetical protein